MLAGVCLFALYNVADSAPTDKPNPENQNSSPKPENSTKPEDSSDDNSNSDDDSKADDDSKEDDDSSLEKSNNGTSPSPDLKNTKLTTNTSAKDSKQNHSKELKEVMKAGKKNMKDCPNDCDASGFDPVCAHDPSDSSVKPRSFGSMCAVEVANCESGSSKKK